MVIPMQTPESIREAAYESRLTIRAMAGEMGISPVTLHNLLSGRRPITKIYTLAIWSVINGVKVDA